MTEWKECALNEVAENVTVGFVGTMAQEYVPKGVPFLRSLNVKPFKVDTKDIKFITEEFDKRISKSSLRPGNVVIVRTGNPGTCAIIPDTIPEANCSDLVIVRTGPKLDNHFFVYYMNSVATSHVHAHLVGAVQQHFNVSSAKSMKMLLPPLPEQRAIAAVLSSLDDKISLLQRQNKTLESMAETLFRQWFVEEAEDGWKERSLLELIKLVGGGTPKTAIPEYWDGQIAWLAGGDIASNHKSFVLNAEKKITEEGLNNSSAKLLPKFATVISARGTVGKYCLLANPMTFSQSNYGILPQIEGCFFFTYLLINHVVAELQSAAYGSVFDTITTTTFEGVKMPTPSESEIQVFEKTVSAYFHKILLNKTQIDNLETLRNTMLPKLMSGEVRVLV